VPQAEYADLLALCHRRGRPSALAAAQAFIALLCRFNGISYHGNTAVIFAVAAVYITVSLSNQLSVW